MNELSDNINSMIRQLEVLKQITTCLQHDIDLKKDLPLLIRVEDNMNKYLSVIFSDIYLMFDATLKHEKELNFEEDILK